MTSVSISIDVPDRERATEFFVAALGCTKVRDQAPNMTVLSAGNIELYLLQRAHGSNAATSGERPRDYGRHWTPIHLDFLVDDVEGAVERVVAAGGVHEGGEQGEWGAIAYCADPFGNGFCLIRE